MKVFEEAKKSLTKLHKLGKKMELYLGSQITEPVYDKEKADEVETACEEMRTLTNQFKNRLAGMKTMVEKLSDKVIDAQEYEFLKGAKCLKLKDLRIEKEDSFMGTTGNFLI